MEPDAVRQQVAKICASPGFANAERLSRFLRFTVETVLNGDRDQIKEYLIGREVFDRDERYDTRMDPIVRVEARRLRTRLDEYYAGAGAQDPIRIDFPKGSYAPLLTEAVPKALPKPERSGRRALAIAAACILVILCLVLWARPAKANRIAIVPAHWVGNQVATHGDFEDALVESVTAELARRGAEVTAWPAMLRFRGTTTGITEIAQQMHSPRILMIGVRGESLDVSVNAHLFDTGTNRKLRVGEYRRNISQSMEVQRELARVIADEFQSAITRAE